jgi:hypothetical protein
MNAQDLWSLAGDGMRQLAVGAVGVFAGAMLTEAGVLVPYWRSLDAETFHRWYRANAARLVDFFGPLTWIAGLSALTSALWSLRAQHAGATWAAVAAVLMLIVVAMFPAYFKRANASFVAGFASSDETVSALRDWAAWHWVRTSLSVGALVAAVLAAH